MRSDMFKVIVERPRCIYPKKAGSAYPRGELEGRWSPDFELAPAREGMGSGYGWKRLNENLRPLVRYLQSNVGRPWWKVYSEIAQHLSIGSAVQKHVLDHLHDFVEENAVIRDGRVMRPGGSAPLVARGWRLLFFVCPRSGLLRLAPRAPRWAPPPRPRLPKLPDGRYAWKSGEVWYALTVAPIPRDVCAMRSLRDARDHLTLYDHAFCRGSSSDPLFSRKWYAVTKRQLGRRDIARFGLREEGVR
jgi:hypothetical protein